MTTYKAQTSNDHLINLLQEVSKLRYTFFFQPHLTVQSSFHHIVMSFLSRSWQQMDYKTFLLNSLEQAAA